MKQPIHATWDGEAFVPMKRFAKACDAELVTGKVYCLDTIEERSIASHRQYFAALHDAWVNLPEEYAQEFPSSEHLRKWALIKAGFCDERVHVCANKREAHEIAAFMRPLDDFALIVPFDNLVKCWTAKSQSMKAMGKADFQASKSAVLGIVAGIIGVAPDQLGKQAA